MLLIHLEGPGNENLPCFFQNLCVRLSQAVTLHCFHLVRPPLFIVFFDRRRSHTQDWRTSFWKEEMTCCLGPHGMSLAQFLGLPQQPAVTTSQTSSCFIFIAALWDGSLIISFLYEETQVRKVHDLSKSTELTKTAYALNSAMRDARIYISGLQGA